MFIFDSVNIDNEGGTLVPQTIQIPKQGPGRPKTRNTTPVTLNLDIKVAEYLAEMALQYGLHRNHIIETLILSARNDSYPLQVKEENERLKERIKQLESELMELKEKCGGIHILERLGCLKREYIGYSMSMVKLGSLN
jgi:hypothetical protein